MVKSKGLGDSVEKVLKATGIDKVAKKVLGDDCGCEERKQKLNKMFPYSRPFTNDELSIYPFVTVLHLYGYISLTAVGLYYFIIDKSIGFRFFLCTWWQIRFSKFYLVLIF